MNTKKRRFQSIMLTLVASLFVSAVLQQKAFTQGYIVPNGVVYAGDTGIAGYEIDVLRNPTNGIFTGFFLKAVSKTQPTTYTNTFAFQVYVDVSVRVFLVGSNQPVSLAPILAGSYPELQYFNSYVFNHNEPFYVGLFTGADRSYPPDGIYKDPLFGWAQLVNDRGVIRLLDSALSYKTQGIYAGTQNFVVPEPSAASLSLFGVLVGLLRPARKPRMP